MCVCVCAKVKCQMLFDCQLLVAKKFSLFFSSVFCSTAAAVAGAASSSSSSSTCVCHLSLAERKREQEARGGCWVEGEVEKESW